MKFLINAVIGFGAALLFFLGFLLKENQLFKLKNSLQTPFEKEEILNKEEKISEKEFQDFFLPTGGFVRAYKNSSIDFSKGKNEIIFGEVFISGGLKNHKNPEIINILDISIEIGEKSIFVSIDPLKRFIKIFSINENIDIYSKEHFLLTVPQKQMISIKVSSDQVVPKKIPPYNKYFDLRNKWNLTSWEKNEKSNQINKTYQEYEAWSKKFKPYALNFIENWSTGTPSSIFSKILKFYSFAQRNYSIGFPEKKKKKWAFGIFLDNIADGQNYFYKNDFASAEKMFEKFHSDSQKNEWTNFLQENNFIEKDWKYFEWAQKIWLASMNISDQKKVFKTLWVPKDEKEQTKGSILEKKLNNISYLITRNEFKKAQLILAEIESDIKKWEETAKKEEAVFSETDRAAITKMRRIFSNLLLNFKSFQNVQTFEVYERTILYEKNIYKDDELLEITIEIAQEIFLLAKKFLETESEKSISNFITRLWKDQNVHLIEKEISQSLFTEEQKELVKFVKIASNSALTSEEITQIKKAELLEQSFGEGIKSFENEKESESFEETNTSIENPKELLNFLESKKISINLSNFKTNNETQTSSFSQAKFYDKRLSGEFDYVSQRFLVFSINGVSHEIIHKNFINKLLAKIEADYNQRQKALEEKPEPVEETAIDRKEFLEIETDILQNTEKSILSRRFIQSVMINLGFKLDRKNIFILDEEVSNFEIILSEIFKIHFLRFTYNKNDKIFSNIKGIYPLLAIPENTETGAPERKESEETITISETLSWENLEIRLKEEIEILENKYLEGVELKIPEKEISEEENEEKKP